jgi:hypothetical protein
MLGQTFYYLCHCVQYKIDFLRQLLEVQALLPQSQYLTFMIGG